LVSSRPLAGRTPVFTQGSLFTQGSHGFLGSVDSRGCRVQGTALRAVAHPARLAVLGATQRARPPKGFEAQSRKGSQGSRRRLKSAATVKSFSSATHPPPGRLRRRPESRPFQVWADDKRHADRVESPNSPTTTGLRSARCCQTSRGCPAYGPQPLRPPDRESAAPPTPKSFRRWAASKSRGFGMRYLHRHWPGINPPLLQTAALPAGQLMEQGGEPCAEQKL
jgi:hypothetical protein